jgi:hypothetical protein
MSRTGSTISTVSHLHTTATMAMSSSQTINTLPLPRNKSHDRNYRMEQSYLANAANKEMYPEKRHRPSRANSYNESGIGPSPLGSSVESDEGKIASSMLSRTNCVLIYNTETSPVASSGTSASSSSDHLEIPPLKLNRKSYSRPRSMVPQATTYAETNIFKNLHTSTTRKLGEAPIMENPPPLAPIVHKATLTAAQPHKKNRWSLMGKRNSAALAT